MDARLLLAASASVGIGILAGTGRSGQALAFTAAGLAALAVAAVMSLDRSVRWAPVAAGLLGIALCAAADASWRAVAEADRILPKLVHEETQVCGTVTLRRPRSVQVDAREVRHGERAWAVREPVRIAGEDATRPRPGAAVCATGVVLAPRPGRKEAPLVVADEVTRAGVRGPVRFAASSVRDRFRAAATGALPDRQAGLLLGMTDGDIELLDDATVESFRTTGQAHLVAVSGSNVAVVLAIVLLACRWIAPRSRWTRVLIALPLLVFFAFLTALEASVLRATVSAGIVLAVTASGRAADGLRAASVAFCVLVLADPSLMLHPGFQLSFGATVGLIVWAAPLSLVWSRRGRRSRARR